MIHKMTYLPLPRVRGVTYLAQKLLKLTLGNQENIITSRNFSSTYFCLFFSNVLDGLRLAKHNICPIFKTRR